MKQILPYLFVVFCGPLSGAQAANPIVDTLLTKIDRLHREPRSLGRDTTLVLAVSLLTERMCNQHDSRAPAYIDTLRQIVRTTGWNKGEGLVWRALGKQQDIQGNYKAALRYYLNAIDALKRAGGDTYELAYAHVLAAFLLSNNGMIDECKKYLKAALPLARQNRNTNNLCWILDFWGDYNYYENFGVQDYRKALGYYKQVEYYLPRATSPNLIVDNLHCLANCYQQLGQEKIANQYRQQAIEKAQITNNRVVLFALQSDWATYYLKKNQPAKAVHYARQALSFAQASHWVEMVSRAEKLLSDAYVAAGDYKRAFEMSEQHRSHEDSLGRQALQVEYVRLKAQYNDQKKQLTIVRLEEENLLKTRNYFIVLLLLSALLLGGGTFMIWRLRRTNQLLTTKNREVEAALMRGQIQERKRVASELHDSLSTRVAAISWQLEALPAHEWPTADQQIMQNTLLMVNGLYTDIRQISHNYVPMELATNGLIVALQRLVDRLNQNNRLQFHLETDLSEVDIALSLKHQLYTIALELLNNVIKHAQAHQVWISLIRMNAMLLLTVSDDGVGYQPNQTTSGVGLQNISSRVDTLRGKLRVVSKPNRDISTMFEVQLPVQLIDSIPTAIQ